VTGASGGSGKLDRQSIGRAGGTARLCPAAMSTGSKRFRVFASAAIIIALLPCNLSGGRPRVDALRFRRRSMRLGGKLDILINNGRRDPPTIC